MTEPQNDITKMNPQDAKDHFWKLFVMYRNVEDPCPECSGLGVKTYASTATWAGGIGGMTATSGVCDKCWGSGDKNRPWTNLKKVRSMHYENERLKQEQRELCYELIESNARRLLETLQDNWDGEGSKKLSKEKVEYGLDILKKLSEKYSLKGGYVVPVPATESFQIEWHDRVKRLEIEFIDINKVYFYISVDGREDYVSAILKNNILETLEKVLHTYTMEGNWETNKDCPKCKGAGWLWRGELDSARDWDGTPDDTQYSCDHYCHDNPTLYKLIESGLLEDEE